MADLAYFTLKEASTIVGLSPNKLRREIHDGELSAMLVGTRYVVGESRQCIC